MRNKSKNKHTVCVWPRAMTKSATRGPFCLVFLLLRALWEIVRFNCTRACRFSYLNWPQNTFLIACAQAHTVGAALNYSLFGRNDESEWSFYRRSSLLEDSHRLEINREITFSSKTHIMLDFIF